MQVLKQESDLHQRILKAEEILTELELSISYLSEGILITDTRTGNQFATFQDIEYSFPRCCECRFKLL